MAPKGLTLAQALNVVGCSPLLANSISDAFVTCGTPEADKELAQHAAAELYASGWLHRQNIAYGGKEKFRTIKHRRKEAVKELQVCGILPTGFEWLIVRWVILPFLSALIQSWLSDRLWFEEA